MASVAPVLRALQALAIRPEGDDALDRLAQQYGQSKFHFHRNFVRQAGETPKQYARRLRIERAAHALATRSDTILAIALDHGFASHETFTRAFRRLIGCTPRAYRARCRKMQASSQAAASRDHVRRVGPCIRLYRSGEPTDQERSNMPTSEISLQTVERQPIQYIRRRAARTQLQAVFAECFPKIFQYCLRSGIAIAGQPVARYVATGQGLWTVDSAIPVTGNPIAEGEIEAGELRAGPTAVAVHEGDYAALGETHAAIEGWIEDQGLVADGAPWESFTTSPAEYPDVADWRTEVRWPVRTADAGSAS